MIRRIQAICFIGYFLWTKIQKLMIKDKFSMVGKIQ